MSNNTTIHNSQIVIGGINQYHSGSGDNIGGDKNNTGNRDNKRSIYKNKVLKVYVPYMYMMKVQYDYQACLPGFKITSNKEEIERIFFNLWLCQ